MSTTTPEPDLTFAPRCITLHLGDKFEDPVIRIWNETDDSWRIEWAPKNRYSAAHSVLVNKRDAEFKFEELAADRTVESFNAK